MDILIKQVLSELALIVNVKENFSSIASTVLEDFSYIGTIKSYTINHNCFWAVEIVWYDENGDKHYSFCVNINWFPVEECMQ